MVVPRDAAPPEGLPGFGPPELSRNGQERRTAALDPLSGLRAVTHSYS